MGTLKKSIGRRTKIPKAKVKRKKEKVRKRPALGHDRLSIGRFMGDTPVRAPILTFAFFLLPFASGRRLTAPEASSIIAAEAGKTTCWMPRR
jgi:hypothetical protein